ncbi:MAG: Rrf2 family transcriptional regulator [Planctomycetes bacterium]|nr:Rrf2 family transcriptional regulator [Planctomycetota bacterium]
MKISNSTNYALLMAGYLAEHPEQKMIQSEVISEKYDLPHMYLLKILGMLVKANILRSKRGPQGGFSLARPPKKINLLEIIEAVEGPMIGSLDMEVNAKRAKFCKQIEQICEKAAAQARDVLKNTTLADLVK